jgi:hypothetical protein
MSFRETGQMQMAFVQCVACCVLREERGKFGADLIKRAYFVKGVASLHRCIAAKLQAASSLGYGDESE